MNHPDPVKGFRPHSEHPSGAPDHSWTGGTVGTENDSATNQGMGGGAQSAGEQQ